MSRLRSLAGLALLSIAAAAPAFAQEAIPTAPAGGPPLAHNAASATDPRVTTTHDETSPAAIGRWAQDVMGGAPSQPELAAAPEPDARACPEPVDHKPHGQVWAGVGTHGYREAGGVVTQPVGKCGSVTLAIEHAQGAGGRWVSR